MDGLERDLRNEAEVIRVDILSKLGRDIAGRYGIVGVPSTLVIDGDGHVVMQQGGIPDRGALRDAARSLIE